MGVTPAPSSNFRVRFEDFCAISSASFCMRCSGVCAPKSCPGSKASWEARAASCAVVSILDMVHLYLERWAEARRGCPVIHLGAPAWRPSPTIFPIRADCPCSSSLPFAFLRFTTSAACVRLKGESNQARVRLIATFPSFMGQTIGIGSVLGITKLDASTKFKLSAIVPMKIVKRSGTGKSCFPLVSESVQFFGTAAPSILIVSTSKLTMLTVCLTSVAYWRLHFECEPGNRSPSS